MDVIYFALACKGVYLRKHPDIREQSKKRQNKLKSDVF